MGNQTGKKFTMETNDFAYYMSLLRKNIDTKFTGKLEDLEKLKQDIELYINVMKAKL
jgi:hypothetical protein